jgi:hypothetical protein
MKKIALTFDYEIFFGKKSGLPSECIFKPTDRLINIFMSKNMKGTFFIDVIYYLRLLENPETFQDALFMKEQLKKIVKQGSRIELHLHTHWLDAIYSEEQWIFPTYDRYRLQNLKTSEISDLVKKGVDVLEEIAREVSPTYKVVAFRAGGFCIQPFTKLAKALNESGIIIDSSVVPGLYENGEVRYIDFRNAPKYEIYRFSNDPTVINQLGNFIEVPISTYRTTIIHKIKNKIKDKIIKKTKCNLKERGEGLIKKSNFIEKIKPQITMISPDGNIDHIEIIQNIKKIKKNLVTVIAHPKSLTESSFNFFNNLSEEKYKFITINELI